MKHFIDLHEDVGIEELNYLLDQMESVEKLTLNYPTDKRYSEEYVHYNKKEVWEDLLNQN